LLAHHRVAFEAREIFRQPLSAAEIRDLLRRSSLEEIFSWRSPTARARGLQPGSLSEEEAIRLMTEEPRLIRRPLIVTEDRIIAGADAAAIAALAG